LRRRGRNAKTVQSTALGVPVSAGERGSGGEQWLGRGDHYVSRGTRHFSGFSNFSDSAFRQKVQVRIDYQGSKRISYSQSLLRTGYSFVGSGKQYALFRFDVGSQTDYGWLELQLGNIGDSAPFIRLIGYAYDTSGKPIPAGAIPEPKHLPLALGALALGAVGLREWRKKRNATA
jgi:hypothetical protein